MNFHQTRPSVFHPRFLRGLICLSLLILSTSLVDGADFKDLPADKREAWVKEQIAKLDANTLRERAEAERSLWNAGPEVLPFLPPPELLPSVAVRQAVRRVRVRLEEAKARDSIKASRVSIKGTLPLADILKKITEQTGNSIDISPLPAERLKQPIPLDAERLSFWEVMDQLGAKAKFRLDTWQSEGESSKLQLQPASAETKPAAAANIGAFRVEVAPVRLSPRFGVEDQQLLRVPIRLFAEPRLRPLFLKIAGKDFTARTPGGALLEPFNPAASLELPLGEAGTATSFSMDFQVPKPFREKSIEFSGKATLTVAAGSEQIAFRDLAKDAGAARRKGGVTVTLSEVQFSPGKQQPSKKSARFQIIVHYDTGGPAFESHRTWMFHNRVYLEDEAGRRFERNNDFHTALQTDGGVIVDYNFNDLAGDADDYKFVYVAPTLIINVPIAWEFKNLPVPMEEMKSLNKTEIPPVDREPGAE